MNNEEIKYHFFLNGKLSNWYDSEFILRGIRYVSDFEYEKTIADANRTLDRSIETIFLTGEPKFTSVASTIVRDILKHKGNASLFLPDVNGVLKFIGATSFHSKTSNCAELESLSMLRQALYNHLSINTITKLQESLHNNLYKPARGTTNYMQQHKLYSS